MGDYIITYYEKANGSKPAMEFLESLPEHLQVKGFRDIDILRERGPKLRPPASKHIKDGLFELRIQSSGDSLRVFYFFFHRGEIVLTNGFLKKSRKTPQRELRRALRYMRDWKRRKAQ